MGLGYLSIQNESKDALVLSEFFYLVQLTFTIFFFVGLYMSFDFSSIIGAIPAPPSTNPGCGIALMLISLVLLFGFAYKREILIDKKTGRIVISDRFIVKNERKEFAFSEIVLIALKKRTRDKLATDKRRRGANAGKVHEFGIYLFLKNNEQVMLDRGSKITSGFGLALEEKTGGSREANLAKKIAGFVGVPFEEA